MQTWVHIYKLYASTYNMGEHTHHQLNCLTKGGWTCKGHYNNCELITMIVLSKSSVLPKDMHAVMWNGARSGQYPCKIQNTETADSAGCILRGYV